MMLDRNWKIIKAYKETHQEIDNVTREETDRGYLDHLEIGKIEQEIKIQIIRKKDHNANNTS